MILAVKYFLGFLLWNLLAGLILLTPRVLPPPSGILLSLAFTYWVLFAIVLRRGRPGEARRWAVLRLRPLRGDALRWTLAALPVLLMLNWALYDFYFRLVPTPPETLDPLAPYEPLLRMPFGELSLTLFAIGVAPIMEEFFFRGLILSALARRLTAGGAILASALLFALVHGFVWFLPLYLVLGLIFGFAVHATRSIWAGVLLHTANNAAAMLGTALPEGELEASGTFWEFGLTLDWWISLGLLLATGAVAVWIGRRLWEAGQGARLRASRPSE